MVGTIVGTERSVEEERVLRALAWLEDEGHVPTVHAVAIRSGLDMSIVFPLLNVLFTSGDVTPQLTLTAQGRAAG